MTRIERDAIATKVLGAAIQVHKNLGPGLLENVYEWCLIAELAHCDIYVESQVMVPIYYRGKRIPHRYFKIDLLVEHEIVIELKAVEKIHPVYFAQLLTYLRLANKRLGYLLNFNVPVLKNGIYRRVNGFD